MSAPETPGAGPADRVHEVLVVGSGFAGLGQLLALRRAGITDVVLLEKAEALGGTWRDNTYPGCACDIPSHLYSFSFEPNPDWSRSYSPAAGDPRVPRAAWPTQYDLRRHVRFGTEVTGAAWDDAEPHLDGAHPRRASWRARVLVPGVGALHLPEDPDLPGLERFEGRPSTPRGGTTTSTCAGKRVAVIGTGASAIQFVPADRRRRGGGAALPAHPRLGPAQARQAAPGGPAALLRP